MYLHSLGNEFESELIHIASTYARKTWGVGSIKLSSARQDRFEGTDLFVLGIPVDVTLAFSRKNRTRKLGVLNFDGVTVEFGIRFGNGKVKFQTPVLVIGAETTTGITKSNMWVVVDAIRSRIGEILDQSMDQYLLATATD